MRSWQHKPQIWTQPSNTKYYQNSDAIASTASFFLLFQAKPEKLDPKPVEKIEAASSASFEQNLRSKLSKPSEAKKPSKDSSLEEIFPVDKKPHQRSKKPLHRIDITDVDADATDSDATAVTLENFVDSDGKKFSEKLRLASAAEAELSVDKIEVISSTENTRLAKSPTPAGDEMRPVVKPSVVSAQKKVEEEIMKSMSNKLSIDESGDESSSIKFKRPPKSSVQFISEWKQCKTSAGQAKYVRLLQDPAKDYARIFKHSMETNIFNDLVKLLSSSDIFNDPAEICRHLVGISRVPRIVALVMFLSSGEKRLLQDMVENFVRNNSSLKDEEKSQVLKAFR